MSVYLYRLDCFQIFNFALHFALVMNLQFCFIMTKLDVIFITEGFGECKEIFKMVNVVGDQQGVICLSNSGDS